VPGSLKNELVIGLLHQMQSGSVMSRAWRRTRNDPRPPGHQRHTAASWRGPPLRTVTVPYRCRLYTCVAAGHRHDPAADGRRGIGSELPDGRHYGTRSRLASESPRQRFIDVPPGARATGAQKACRRSNKPAGWENPAIGAQTAPDAPGTRRSARPAGVRTSRSAHLERTTSPPASPASSLPQRQRRPRRLIQPLRHR